MDLYSLLTVMSGFEIQGCWVQFFGALESLLSARKYIP